MMESPERENTSITPPGRRFGNLKLSGLIRTKVFSTCALAGEGATRSRVPPAESENSAQSFKTPFNALWLKRRQHSRLKVGHVACIIGDVIAIGITNRFATGALVHNMTNSVV